MEVYAGFVSFTDHHFGRILDTLEQIGELDDTIIMVISDNGASAEGGPQGSANEMLFFNNAPESLEENLAKIDTLGDTRSYNHYPWGWAWAGDTPFRRWKRETYRGGSTDPFIMSWPAGMKARGEVREQYAHAIDMVPTVLDALGIEAPDAIRGVTQSPSRASPSPPRSTIRSASSEHTTQYFEMFGHRAIDHDGWRAVCPWPGVDFTTAATKGRAFGSPIGADGARRAGDRGLGALPHHRRPDRVARTSRQSTPTSCVSSSRCGGWRPASTRSCPSTATSRAAWWWSDR